MGESERRQQGAELKYASYLATREEYAKQWYEGASTQFGPNQQAAFQQEFVKLSLAMVQGHDVPAGPSPVDVTADTVDLTPKVVFDDTPWGKDFGDVMTPPASHYALGDTVNVSFWGAHPNNDYRIQDSFLVVEKQVGSTFQPVAHDWDPNTTYRWERRGLANSKVTITWDTTGAEPGIYRIRHRGNAKSKWRHTTSAYEGVSNTFVVK